MITPEPLYLACLSDPGNDTTRLVLADWFDENGEPERAELVRVQVELSRPIDCRRPTYNTFGQRFICGEKWQCDPCKRRDELERREYVLLAHADAWRRPPCPGCGGELRTRVWDAEACIIRDCPACRGVGSTHPLGEKADIVWPTDAGWKHPARLVRGLWVVTADLAELGREVPNSCLKCGYYYTPRAVLVRPICWKCEGTEFGPLWQPTPWAISCVRHGVAFGVGDVAPRRVSDRHGSGWVWVAVDRLPQSLWNNTVHPTEQAAHDALNAELLRLTLEAAGSAVAA